jgi:transcriptional regulator with XRE-family HTH domain
LRQDISRLLRAERESAGITHVELAGRAGVSAASLSRIERGTLAPSVDNLEKIFAALGRKVSFTVEAMAEPAPPLDVQLRKAGIGQLLKTLEAMPCVVDGALAAAVRGEATSVEELDLDVAWRDSGRMTGWLVRRLAYRWDDGHKEFRLTDLDPRAPGPHLYQTALGRVRLHMVDELPDAQETTIAGTKCRIRL